MWVASLHSGSSSNITSSRKPSKDTGHQQIWTDISCHFIHTAPFVFTDWWLSKIILFVYCLLLSFTCLLSLFWGPSLILGVVLSHRPVSDLQFNKCLLNKCVNVWSLWSEFVSGGMEEELMRGRGGVTWPSDAITAAVTTSQLMILGLLRNLLVSWQAQLNSPLPLFMWRARFHCATLCSKFPSQWMAQHRINWRLTKKSQTLQFSAPENRCVLGDSLRA